MVGILLLTAGRKDSLKTVTTLPPIEAQTKNTSSNALSTEVSKYEKAVEIIKKYETLHSTRHWPLIGYGHKVLPGEKYSRNRSLSEKEADALLRKDLDKLCKIFRSYGKDSLLLATLAYNIGNGAVSRSSVARKLASGDRDIKANYISHCKYRGKEHAQIKKRRMEEFETLFEPDSIIS